MAKGILYSKKTLIPKDVLTGSFRSSKEGIKEIVWSHDSVYLATSDMDRCVGVYRSKRKGKGEDEPIEWEYIGKYRSHYKPIVGN